MDKFTEKTLGCERKYTGRIISVDLLDIELPDGRKAKREVVRHGNAVAVLARRPDGKFVFVKQYRRRGRGGHSERHDLRFEDAVRMGLPPVDEMMLVTMP